MSSVTRISSFYAYHIVEKHHETVVHVQLLVAVEKRRPCFIGNKVHLGLHPSERPTELPLDETRVEFDEEKMDRIVSDVRDEAHLNARRATQDKYEQEAG
jgi:hypothetical protein